MLNRIGELLIEDDTDICEIICNYFAEEGTDVLAVQDGTEAEALIRAIDSTLTDGSGLLIEYKHADDLGLADRVRIVSAIANHDESYGVASDPVSAALIISDKTDVRRSRVRQKDPSLFDVHDRVNYAVTATRLRCGLEEKRITLYLTIDESICTMYEYFDIFLDRMTMCSHAARILDAQFSLKVNGQRVL